MKYLVLVLSIIVSLSSSGCLATAILGNPPPAGIDVSHNIENTIMLARTQRDGEFRTPVYANGTPLTIPVCGLLPGGKTIVTASFYDKATFNPADREPSYLGSITREFYVYFDGSYRYSDAWQVTYYIPRQEPVNRSVASRIGQAKQAPASAQSPASGGIHIMNNLQGVKVVVSSTEDHRVYPPLVTSQSMFVPVGVDPKTRRFALMAKVYSQTGDYLGYADYRDSIDERYGYGNDRMWKIERFTPVRAQVSQARR